jgi:acetyl/propionyl-CoA carboxylase alpha subunit
VEFVLAPDGEFFFLEMNTRLQVEHPVTELVCGMDLVREQIRVANGETLALQQSGVRQSGHAIECRIYAEVPEEQFRPSVGVIRVFEPPLGPGVRLDSGVRAGAAVPVEFDPMLAKLCVWAENRNAAIERMKQALSRLVILGVRHNVEFLGRIITTEDFRAGRIDTGFIQQRPELFVSSAAEAPIAALLSAALTEEQPPHTGVEKPSVWQSGRWRNG